MAPQSTAFGSCYSSKPILASITYKKVRRVFSRTQRGTAVSALSLQFACVEETLHGQLVAWLCSTIAHSMISPKERHLWKAAILPLDSVFDASILNPGDHGTQCHCTTEKAQYVSCSVVWRSRFPSRDCPTNWWTSFFECLVIASRSRVKFIPGCCKRD